MQAYRYRRYGSPDVLELRAEEMPEVADDAVLVRVHATALNAYDWHMMRGKPYLARLGEGFRRPKGTALGIDVAGIVEAVGARVTHLAPGDRVYGSRTGAFAEYVSGRTMERMPANLEFEEAAAIPVAGQTALQGLRDVGGLRAGQRVLVNGAGGGVGTFAVQIAKALGAEVTAVTRAAGADMVRSLGADAVIDRDRDDFTRGGRRYDIVLDIGGGHSLSALRRALVPGGVAVLVAPAPGQWIGPVARVVGAAVSSRFTTRKVRPFLSSAKRGDLATLRELVESGRVRPVVDRTYPFDALPQAMRHLESGGVRGKIVVRL